MQDNQFDVMEVFPEGQIMKMGKKAMSGIGVSDEEFYEGMGYFFVEFAAQYGWAEVQTFLVSITL